MLHTMRVRKKRAFILHEFRYSFVRSFAREREIKRAQNVTIMAPESFNASLPERDIIIAKCVFCYKSEACQNADTRRSFFISTFFSLFS